MTETNIQNTKLEAGVFGSIDEAKRAVHGLLGAGFTKDEITVVCSDTTKERYFHEFDHQDPAGTHTPRAAIVGGTIGAAIGGLSVIAAAAATGGVALFAAGPVTAWAGGVTGGLIGAMMTRGVEKELADYYQQAVIEGQILVAAEDSGPNQHERLSQAAKILAEAGAKPLPMREG